MVDIKIWYRLLHPKFTIFLECHNRLKNSAQRFPSSSKLTNNCFSSGTAAALPSLGSQCNASSNSSSCSSVSSLLEPNPVAKRIMEQIAIASSCVVGNGVGTTRSDTQPKLMSRAMQLAKTFNSFFLNKLSTDLSGLYKPFIIDNFQLGIVPPEVYRQLVNYPDVFVFVDGSVQMAPHLNDYESRSQAMDRVMRDLRGKDVFTTLRGWREECYEVSTYITDQPFMRIERSAACLFGFRQYGVDINGYVNHPTKGLCLWLQRRAKTKARWGGKLDNMVGGGLSVGYNVVQTAHKESAEEASVPESLLQNLIPVGAVSIFYESERGLSPNTEFVYDLELPLDFIPENQDGEVDSFHLMTAAEALKAVLSPDFKTTSSPVALDFFIRHGVINPKNEPDILLLQELLHIPLHLIYRKIM